MNDNDLNSNSLHAEDINENTSEGTAHPENQDLPENKFKAILSKTKDKIKYYFSKEYRQKRKEKVSNRIWELDFLRGFCILLMCVDHFFVDIESMYYGWISSDNSVLNSMYHAASRYMGVSSDRVMIPVDKMQLCEYVFLWLIVLLATISFIIPVIKNKTKPDKRTIINFSITIGIAVAACAAMAIVNQTIGYETSAHTVRDFIHPIILWFFFLLCGIGCRLSRNNFKRALQIGICAGLISLFTYLAEVVLDFSGVLVRYGVLHMLATAVLIYALVELFCKLLVKDPEKRKYVLSAICFAIGVVGYCLNQYFYFNVTNLPRTDWLAWFHYSFADAFESSDWFTISESLYKVMFGAAIAPFLYPEKKSLFPKLKPLNKGAFCFMGRHTLWVVLIHQLILSLGLYLINFAC